MFGMVHHGQGLALGLEAGATTCFTLMMICDLQPHLPGGLARPLGKEDVRRPLAPGCSDEELVAANAGAGLLAGGRGGQVGARVHGGVGVGVEGRILVGIVG